MELSKNDSKAAKGIAILGMLMLHLFCRLDALPYTPLVWIGKTPLIYYLGLFGDICVPAYCFLSGYAQILLMEKEGKQYSNKRYVRILKFLINYWLVLCVFALVGLLFDKTNAIPGSILKFAGNFLLYGISYNGAWWFVLTYIWLVISAPIIVKICRKWNSVIVFFVSGCFYFASYLFRFRFLLDVDNTVLNWLWTQFILFGTSQFPFVVGALFYKHKLITALRKVNMKATVKNALCVAFVLLAFVFHCFVPSLIVAPITAIVALSCFWVAKKPKALEKVLLFLGDHSTNLWLVHMFFYLTLFNDLVFVAKYPALILAFMLALCVASSYLIKLPYNLIIKRIGK